MITSPKTLEKLRRLEATYGSLVYEPVQSLDCLYFETDEHRRLVPGDEAPWRPCPAGTSWGHAWGSAWFKATVVVPESMAGHPVYIVARTGGVESLFWIDGNPRGLFNFDPWIRIRGDHRAQRLDPEPTPGRRYTVAFESYAGHPFVGTQPFDTAEKQNMYPATPGRRFDAVELCRRWVEIEQFVLDLRALNQLSSSLPAESFRKGEVDTCLVRVFALVPQNPASLPRAQWLSILAEARALMRPLLAKRNGDSAPFAGLVGHSHMDTAWCWTIDETIRKCARTYANALSLMEQYPEYVFVQSSTLHAEWMRRHYPSIFEGIRRRVAEGRWEPNGGGWIEPDVNLAGGESLIRQFLYGQSFTRKYFNYTSDTFWLPDTFGYSAALPQILHGCGIRYFATTKLTWNETNTFPYDTFWWEGIDGTRVLAHFPDIHCAPDPETLINKLHGTGPKDFRVVQNCVRHKDVNQRRLIAYGFGDGGGGPDPQMIEMARRCRNLEGCPRAEHTRVGAFMKDLEQHAVDAPVYSGELYLECHRGTLTQQHEIKHRNRRAEIALREAEWLVVATGDENDATRSRLRALWETLLMNQFHDILPGTSIGEVHDRAIRELGEVIADAGSLARSIAARAGKPAVDAVTVFNSLSWDRREFRMEGFDTAKGLTSEGATGQHIEHPWGDRSFVMEGAAIPAMGSRTFTVVDGLGTMAPGPFERNGDVIITPHARIVLDPAGGFSSMVDRASGRELRNAAGLPLNSLVFGEDVPAAWDNWDIDPDLPLKLRPSLVLKDRRVVANGPLQLRVRQSFTFGSGSALTQDIVFHASSARVDFETVIDWNEKQAYLGALFPLDLRATSARHEIQFGHIERPTHRNMSEDRARFEVCQHRWTDVSENRFGVALLNDGKYGVSVEGACIRLSLHRGGCHPDPRGDAGRHIITYSLLPHDGGFTSETVVRPATELNVPVTFIAGTARVNPLLSVDAPNVIVESVKPAQDGRGCIVRLYECERNATRTRIRLSDPAWSVEETNLLEEPIRTITAKDGTLGLAFRAFEIKTLRLSKVNA